MEDPRPNGSVVTDPAQMSEVSTILNVFMEPGRVFEDLRRKPRFLIGLILIALLSGATVFALQQKLGEDGIRRAITEQFDRNPQAASMPAEQKSRMIDLNMTIQKFLPLITPLVVGISIVIIGLFYFLGAKAFGGSGGFLHALSVVVYSWIPTAIVGTIAGMIVLLLKSAEEIDLVSAQRGGLVQANLSLLVDTKAQPVLAAILSTFDLFQIWGWILAAIGLRICYKLSSGSAWAIVVIFALVGVLFRVIGAFFS